MQAMLRWLDPILNPLACLPPLEAEPVTENADSLLKRLEALLQHQLRYALTGERRSIIRGQGLDFADLREYTPGDDIRKIDWNVFARTLTPHIREYHEEKQLTLWLVMDMTASMRFGKRKSKLQQALDLAGLLGMMAHRANHKLGSFVIVNNTVQIIPPQTGYAHLQRILQAMLDCSQRPERKDPPSGPDPDPLPTAFQKLSHLVQKNATVLILSDFLTFSPQWQHPLGKLSRSSKLVYLMLQDPVELQLPTGLGLLTVVDPETGQTGQVDTNDLRFSREYQAAVRHSLGKRQQLLKETGLVAVASTDTSPLDTLLTLLQAVNPTSKTRGRY
jgi:uncharacterized protein (DUF58 family)